MFATTTVGKHHVGSVAGLYAVRVILTAHTSGTLAVRLCEGECGTPDLLRTYLTKAGEFYVVEIAERFSPTRC
jgi:hypothetical protein